MLDAPHTRRSMHQRCFHAALVRTHQFCNISHLSLRCYASSSTRPSPSAGSPSKLKGMPTRAKDGANRHTKPVNFTKKDAKNKMSGHQQSTRPPPKKQNLRPVRPNANPILDERTRSHQPGPPQPSPTKFVDDTLRHKQREPVAGEWQATPPRGLDPEPFRDALLQKNGIWTSGRSTLEDMSKSTEETSEVSEESEFVEMVFLPGTLVDIRR